METASAVPSAAVAVSGLIGTLRTIRQNLFEVRRRVLGLLITVAVAAAVMVGFYWHYGFPHGCSPQYCADLAWSFLHGRLDLIGIQPGVHDVSPFNGKVFIYWGPLPAILMMPIVALRGTAVDFPQRPFAIALAILNSGLFYWLALKTRLALGDRKPEWFAVSAGLFFGLGSSNLIFGVIAAHWVVVQLTASTMTLLALIYAMDRRAEVGIRNVVVSGFFLAMATLSRSNLVLSFPLFAYLACSGQNFDWEGKGDLLERWLSAIRNSTVMKRVGVLLFLAGGAVGLLLLYNYVRFGRWAEFGLTYQNMEGRFMPDFHRYGYFNWRYVVRNLYFNVVRLPGFDEFDHQSMGMGFSLFAQVPTLLLLLRRQVREHAQLEAHIWLAVVLTLVPILTCLCSGYNQFGSRYWHDVVPFLALLIFLRKPSPFWWTVTGGLSIAINIAGTLWCMGRLNF